MRVYVFATRWANVQQRHSGHCGKETSGQGTREKMGNGEGREKPRARGSYVLKLEGIQRSKLEKQRAVE